MSSTTTSTEDRALILLGQGISPEIVAAAVGVTVSRISQLVSNPEFAAAVSQKRYENLSKHNERDNRYDAIEDTLLDRVEQLIPMMYNPMHVMKSLTAINNAKRRGAAIPESAIGQKEVVSLTMPTVVLQQFNTQFVTNINNQVIKAGNQELVTVQSVRMQELLHARKKDIEDARIKVVQGRVNTLLETQLAKQNESYTVAEIDNGASQGR